MANEPLVTIVGNLTADPEVKFLDSGVAVASFTIASTPRTFDRQSNDWKDGETLFMRASAWREFAENIGQNLHKGQRVIAQGNLRQRSFKDKEGNDRTTVELDVQEIGAVIARTKPNAQRAGQGSSAQSGPWQSADIQGGQDTWQGASQGFDPNAPF